MDNITCFGLGVTLGFFTGAIIGICSICILIGFKKK